MTNKERVRIIESNVDKVYEAGQRAGGGGGDSAFWEVYQQGGDRRDYRYAFVHPWDDTIFKPKYDIIATGSEGGKLMFYNTNITDIVGALAACNVSFDCSEVESLYEAFESAKITSIPELYLDKCTDLRLAFRYSQITDLTLRNVQSSCLFDRTFHGCSLLKNLTIYGKIGNVSTSNNGLYLGNSTNLSDDSIRSVIAALDETYQSGGKKVVFPSGKLDPAIEGREEYVNKVAALRNAGWSIS